MSKQLFRVVEVTVCPGCDPTTKSVKSNLSEFKAKGLRDKLQDKQGLDFDPNKLISYLVQPIN